MIWYRVSNLLNSIKEVEVIKETGQYLIIIDGEHRTKVSKYNMYESFHKTREEAKQELIRSKVKKIQGLHEQIMLLQNDLNKIKDI
jgi:hypothetical protein